MQACELAELSGLIAIHGPYFIRRRDRLSDSGLRQYWSAAKRRFEHWMRLLPAEPVTAHGEPAVATQRASSVSLVLEEIFASELLTRIWTAVICQYDSRQGAPTAVPVVWSVLLSHLDARHRALQVMCQADEREREAWLDIDKVRRRCEHWTDLLLAHVVDEGPADVAALAFDADRMREFAADLQDLKRHRRSEQAWQLFQASISEACRTGQIEASPHEPLHSQIAAGVLACFPPELFDATGTLHSLWLERLDHTTDDTLALVEELLVQAAR